MSRELDAQIAERVMGHTVKLDGIGARSFVEVAGVLDLLPAYSTDLNACATAEARIISMGLGEKYARALEDGDYVAWDMNTAYDVETDYAALARVATASAEARCRAMLAVMEGK